MRIPDLQRLVDANPSTDWRLIGLDSEDVPAGLDFCGLQGEIALPALRAYQRLVRVLPVGEEDRAYALLASGLHSAIQIASLPRREFARRWSVLFPTEDALGDAVYRAALGRRSELLLHHIHNVQCNEPHYRAARFK